MLRTLFHLLACVPVFAFNLYGASLIFYESRPLKKAGLLVLFMAVARLAQYFIGLAYPVRRDYMVLSMGVFIFSAFASLLVAAHRRIFQQSHQYQEAHNPKTWRAMTKSGNFFFAHLFPAFMSVAQVLTIFH